MESLYGDVCENEGENADFKEECTHSATVY